MIRINRQTDYAIRVVLALAKHTERQRISTTEVQREMLIPAAFLPRIVAELGRGGFILTFPGRDGGLELARPAEQINLRQVVEYFEDQYPFLTAYRGAPNAHSIQSARYVAVGENFKQRLSVNWKGLLLMNLPRMPYWKKAQSHCQSLTSANEFVRAGKRTY